MYYLMKLSGEHVLLDERVPEDNVLLDERVPEDHVLLEE